MSETPAPTFYQRGLDHWHEWAYFVDGELFVTEEQAIVEAETKRLTDAELAAEFWAQALIHTNFSLLLSVKRCTKEDLEREYQRRLTLERFATETDLYEDKE